MICIWVARRTAAAQIHYKPLAWLVLSTYSFHLCMNRWLAFVDFERKGLMDPRRSFSEENRSWDRQLVGQLMTCILPSLVCTIEALFALAESGCRSTHRCLFSFHARVTEIAPRQPLQGTMYAHSCLTKRIVCFYSTTPHSVTTVRLPKLE